jgi:hypothetical protein
MLKYLDPSNELNQFQIMYSMVCGNKDSSPSFKAAHDFVSPLLNNYSLVQYDSTSYEDWLFKIKYQIDNYFPVAISSRVNQKSVHIRVVLGYCDIENTLVLFNPGVSEYKVSDKDDYISQIKIRSYLEKYSYKNSLYDWNKQDSCKDLLLIEIK